MKALVLKAYNQFVYKDVPNPGMEPDDVLIRVMASGICGSDIHGVDESTGMRVAVVSTCPDFTHPDPAGRAKQL